MHGATAKIIFKIVSCHLSQKYQAWVQTIIKYWTSARYEAKNNTKIMAATDLTSIKDTNVTVR